MPNQECEFELPWIIYPIIFCVCLLGVLCFIRMHIPLPFFLRHFQDLDRWPLDEEEYQQINQPRYNSIHGYMSKGMSPLQLVSILHRGVYAYEFKQEPDSGHAVNNRTQLSFFSGESSLQTNIGLPTNQAVCYWEATLTKVSPTTFVSVGIATKPYAGWRSPVTINQCGNTGRFETNPHSYVYSPMGGSMYGSEFMHGDVIGIGYSASHGRVFFTFNGTLLDVVCDGIQWDMFPTIDVRGTAEISVNLGQSVYRYPKANTLPWGLAGASASVTSVFSEPPPPYGTQKESVLLAFGPNSQPRDGSVNMDSLNQVVIQPAS
ncbi:hypothetical protein PHYBLDRAFT_139002 [Phycomyces blakesleeanus NRRL 1555(-)]|uniref:B30.2/SPRY domain-containing protein n=1 Tax=Phycomyces blakesleeanus (strain ATCC 8743b / DSM 1359 / FGSC 10004 / NBRC 33097 / NRRL 1555) TaxID=763407 RepID=A0A163ETD8_PHYB8|nr:hypothetical protein PHYBLDRAFT_139002 [Phycomyces blakesleeanus NRRL 1555(-)]OAD81450.1 hypothetical protein PHYBLDRAFT_139002 [Phycomyces blakesleeanus NRRL 1555(-)]|eukprot:XP_018299490.1 hypothetical protein PHYBLDRAFT_139002 [Phycomyces blakesleeanus NRRL 1555(-)]